MIIHNAIISCCVFTVFSSVIIHTAQAEIVEARILDINLRDETIYEPRCKVPISVKVSALGSRGDSYFIVISIKHDKTDTWERLTPQESQIRKSAEISGGGMNYQIPESSPEGYYDVKTSIFNGHKTNEGNIILGKKLAEREVSSAFEVIHESSSGCVKFNDSADLSFEKKDLHYYESRSDGLYVDGIKVVSKHTPIYLHIELTDRILIFDSYDQQLTSNVIEISDTPNLSTLVIILLTIVGTTLVILFLNKDYFFRNKIIDK